jgi:hypothetical protein
LSGDNNVEIMLAFATIALAIFTAFLFFATLAVASRTADVAADTVTASQQADTHHQESLTPIVVFKPGLIRLLNARIDIFPNAAVGEGRLRNVGAGPAMNVRMTVQALNAEGQWFGSASFTSGPIGAGEDVEIANGADGEQIVYRPGFDVPAAAASFMVLIDYESLFGGSAGTIHHLINNYQITRTDYRTPQIVERNLGHREEARPLLERLARRLTGSWDVVASQIRRQSKRSVISRFNIGVSSSLRIKYELAAWKRN